MKVLFISALTLFFSLVALSVFQGECFAEETGTDLKVMSFNIRLIAKDGANHWDKRKETLVAEIKENDPLLLGVQEATWPQMSYLSENLTGYAWLGVGRDDGNKGGEFSAVFYKKEAFDLLDSNTFWLSQTPEKAGSLGWDAACRRVVTWGKFKIKKSPEKSFVFANTHFDHKGKVARRESAKLIQTRLAEIAGGLPLLVSGDYNCDNKSEPYKVLTGGVEGRPGLIDSNTVAKNHHLAVPRTFHGFGQIPPEKGSIIDYIFINDKVEVESYTINPDLRDGRFPSDHNSIVIECRLK